MPAQSDFAALILEYARVFMGISSFLQLLIVVA